MTRTKLDVTSLDVTSFEIPRSGLQQSQDDGAVAVADEAWCCTGCDSGCGIIPTGGGCESGGKTYDIDCGKTYDINCDVPSAYPCDSVDICAG